MKWQKNKSSSALIHRPLAVVQFVIIKWTHAHARSTVAAPHSAISIIKIADITFVFLPEKVEMALLANNNYKWLVLNCLFDRCVIGTVPKIQFVKV